MDSGKFIYIKCTIVYRILVKIVEQTDHHTMRDFVILFLVKLLELHIECNKMCSPFILE